MFTLTPKFALARAAFRDPQIRTALFLWLLIGGLCVVLANALAAGW